MEPSLLLIHVLRKGHIINGILAWVCWSSSGDSGPGTQERPEEGYPQDPQGILCLLELAAVTSKIIGLQWISSRIPSHLTQGSHYSELSPPVPRIMIINHYVTGRLLN